MKNRHCPQFRHCRNDCGSCNFSAAFNKLHNRLNRLNIENERLKEVAADNTKEIKQLKESLVYVGKIKQSEDTQVKSAAAKQIPKELDYEGDGYDDNGNIIYDTAFCRNCHHEFEIDYCGKPSYCPDCGQKLNWSEKI